MVMLMPSSTMQQCHFSHEKKQATRMGWWNGQQQAPIVQTCLAMPMKHNTNHTHMYSEQVDVPWEGYHACFNAMVRECIQQQQLVSTNLGRMVQRTVIW